MDRRGSSRSIRPPYSREPGTPSATNQVFLCLDNARGKGLVRCNRSTQRPTTARALGRGGNKDGCHGGRLGNTDAGHGIGTAQVAGVC